MQYISSWRVLALHTSKPCPIANCTYTLACRMEWHATPTVAATTQVLADLPPASTKFGYLPSCMHIPEVTSYKSKLKESKILGSNPGWILRFFSSLHFPIACLQHYYIALGTTNRLASHSLKKGKQHCSTVAHAHSLHPAGHVI